MFRTDNCHEKNIIPAPMTMYNNRNNSLVKNVLSVEKISMYLSIKFHMVLFSGTNVSLEYRVE